MPKFSDGVSTKLLSVTLQGEDTLSLQNRTTTEVSLRTIPATLE